MMALAGQLAGIWLRCVTNVALMEAPSGLAKDCVGVRPGSGNSKPLM
ncbi:hypothetical protein ACFW0H_07710 [Pseudomonas sp. CR3202]